MKWFKKEYMVIKYISLAFDHKIKDKKNYKQFLFVFFMFPN